ncbi:MAG: triose-phosphate isomerase [Sulfurimonas sp.]|nr:MAG: triose-phosphate isomerase [Sulfurimonas sp.]
MIVAANFKTNMTRQSTREYLDTLDDFLATRHHDDDTIMVFPPATALDACHCAVKIGAQNAYATRNGAYTGEIGLEQLDEFDIRTILIGHSERRHILGESQEEIVHKFNFFKEQGFSIIYCIGEPLEIRESGSHALMEYLEAQLEDIDLGYANLMIAYEPVWAIGTGMTPSTDDILLIHNALKKLVQRPLLYGGSVKPENAREIMALANVDGVLVGGASLHIEDFKLIIQATN